MDKGTDDKKTVAMQPFTLVTEPFEADFYTIGMFDGVKCIHIHGYTYKSDDHWASMECSWFIEPLAEFIQNLRSDYNYVEDTLEGLKQYEKDMTDKEMADTINRYFDGEAADGYLRYEDLTEDTPCGKYMVKLDLVIKQ